MNKTAAVEYYATTAPSLHSSQSAPLCQFWTQSSIRLLHSSLRNWIWRYTKFSGDLLHLNMFYSVESLLWPFTRDWARTERRRQWVSSVGRRAWGDRCVTKIKIDKIYKAIDCFKWSFSWALWLITCMHFNSQYSISIV